MNSHTEIDKRSLALHRLIASKIAVDPTLLDVARANIARWVANDTVEHSKPHLDAWLKAIDNGVATTIALLVDNSERGNELRQSAPFAGVLTQRERSDFFRQWAKSSLESVPTSGEAHGHI